MGLQRGSTNDMWRVLAGASAKAGMTDHDLLLTLVPTGEPRDSTHDLLLKWAGPVGKPGSSEWDLLRLKVGSLFSYGDTFEDMLWKLARSVDAGAPIPPPTDPAFNPVYAEESPDTLAWVIPGTSIGGVVSIGSVAAGIDAPGYTLKVGYYVDNSLGAGVSSLITTWLDATQPGQWWTANFAGVSAEDSAVIHIFGQFTRVSDGVRSQLVSLLDKQFTV